MEYGSVCFIGSCLVAERGIGGGMLGGNGTTSLEKVRGNNYCLDNSL